jgi:hypothetical protein
MATVTEAMERLKIEYQKVLGTVVIDMFNEFVHVTPVDTGQLKTSWSMKKKGDGWVLTNNMEYASIIFDGLQFVAGRMYGSNQLPMGLDPVIFKYNKILEDKLKGIRV